MIKSIFLIYIILTPIISFGQTPPSFQSNNLQEKKSSSILSNNMKNISDFDFLIAYHEVGHWNTGIRYTILGFINEKWVAYDWTVYFKSNEKVQGNIRKIKTNRIKFKKENIDSILLTLNSKHFWDLNIDSLNIYESPIDTNVNDSLSALGIVSVQDFRNLIDGSTCVFEIFSKLEYKYLSSYEPEYYIDPSPTNSLLDFIICKEAFLWNLRGKKNDG